ncbi:MAG: acyltransferase [Betaproteobacteria bacterium]|nr:acyltransferase [Betaproteobacteria bacterium]
MNARSHEGRMAVLDGWRGISILLVLATHFLPLGPKAWKLNLTAGPMGMTIFFTLSGFLITNFLLHNASVTEFIIRRFARIVPLAWLALAIGLPLSGAPLDSYLANFLFYANLPPFWLEPATSHFWSLCVEMQFYSAIAVLFLMFRERGLLAIPVLCLLVTAYRVLVGAEISIVTWLRIDEILAGATVALAFNGRLGETLSKWIKWPSPYLLLVMLVASCHPDAGPINYLRPYLAAWLVGNTLFNEQNSFCPVLTHKWLVYVAAISYALYVIHPLLGHTWLGSGATIERYAKRPLLFAALFLLAHLSTFYYEHRWIEFGKQLARRIRNRANVAAATGKAD